MRRSSLIFRCSIVVLLLGFLGFFFTRNGSIGTVQGAKMNALPSRLVPIFANTKTVCIGRYLIDVPASAQVVYGPSRMRFAIERYPGKARELPTLVSTRVSEVDEEKEFADGDLKGQNSMVGNVINGGVPGQRLVFGVSKASGSFYDIRSYTPVGDDVYVQKTQAFPERDRYEESIRKLVAIARNLRTRAEGEIPLEPGVCIDGALVLDTSEPVQEEVTLGVRLKEIPDVHFSLSMTTKNKVVDSDEIHPRLAQAERDAKNSGAAAWFSRIRFLRRGDRAVEGWKGYEVLAHKPPQKSEGEAHEFVFFSQGEPKNRYRPELDIQLDTGVDGDRVGARPPGVTDDEALALWDRLTSSIRVRPAGPPRSTRAEGHASVPARGTVVHANQPCPADGWWKCTDGGDNVGVSGGRLQYFRTGETVPQALLLPPATPWQKLRGEQPMFRSEIPSSWELIDRRKNSRRAPSTFLATAGTSQFAASDEIAKQQNDVWNYQAGASIGTQLSSGSTCTASGWWKCLEPDAFDGARWFANGALLPPATKPVSLTVLEKLKGGPGFVRVAANWQFIRFANSETQGATGDEVNSAASSGGPGNDASVPSEDA